ncbi:MAG: phenylacetate--CoA ligase family protein, partial [Lachnospiraceae bacterium]|nr:phenylacetate--CoA ligase family protein [Lachnospiraceae bacterium]
MKPTKEQLELVDKQVKRLVAGESYYGKMYREMGITEIKSEEDFYKLPFSSKEDLRNAYPLGIQAVPDEEVVRIHSSSGTTGKPVIIP